MTSKLVSFRMKTDSEFGELWQQLIKDGYTPRQIVENAVLMAGKQMPPKDSLDEKTRQELKRAIERLEAIAAALSTGTPLTPSQEREVSDTLNPQFVEAMKRASRPAFRPK